MDFYSKTAEETLEHIKSGENGLEEKEAKRRVEQDGFNELEAKKPKPLAVMFLEQFKDVMIIILIIASVVSAFLGEAVDAAVIIVLVLFNAGLAAWQEKNAEKSLDALKKMSAPNAKVIRAGVQTVIPARELAVGDIVLLDAGDYVPADIRVLESAALKINESALTGEPDSVEKVTGALAESAPLGDRINMAFSSSLVTYGRGRGVVTATGMNTEVGRIAGMLGEAVETQTPMQKRLAALGKVLGFAALGICAVMLGIGLIYGREPLEMFMTAVSLAVAAIPEGLPAISTVVLALGVERMAKRNAIVRTLPSVETLGSATVICSDKTGTLTQNRMTVIKYALPEDVSPVDAQRLENSTLIRALCLCSDAKLTENGAIGDPTETALAEYARKLGFEKAEMEALLPRVSEIPFDSERKLMTTVHSENGKYVVYTKGGMDELLSVCKNVSAELRSRLEKLNLSMAGEALRVLAYGTKTLNALPDDPNELEKELDFVGLTGMIDPPRPEAKQAVALCHTAGIRPVMITGDHALTASAIAKQLDILSEGGGVLTGSELEKLSDEQLFDKVEEISVYARVAPEHKVRIVQAWQKHGEVVAMTGDGVNDAPALKNADIGCSMGKGGTDVAKDASDIILVDDNFATIVSAVEEGRRIYDNILKSVGFLLGGNIAEVIVIFLAIVCNWTTPLVPIHILLINLITDGLPALAMGVDPSEPDIMNRKARKETSLFSRGLIFRMCYQGALIAALTLTGYFIGLKQGVQYAQTMAFVVLALAQISHSFNFHSTTKSIFKANPCVNRALVGAALGSLAIVLACVNVPGLNTVLRLSVLPLGDFLLCCALVLAPIAAVEIMKALGLNDPKPKNQ